MREIGRENVGNERERGVGVATGERRRMRKTESVCEK